MEERGRVLVVEDEEDQAGLYAGWLDDEHDVEVATDGHGALAALDSSVNVVLLDRRLPKMSGEEVLDRIRERHLGCRVAMVTGVEPDLDVVEMRFEDYVVKPVERSELLETVDQLLCLDRCDRQLRRFYALTAKRASLRTAKPGRELRRSDEYATLTREWRRLRRELDESFEELPDQALLTLVDERPTDDGVEPSVTPP